MINVAHDCNDRSTRLHHVVRFSGDKFFELLLDDHLFERNEADIEAEIHSEFDRHRLTDRLVESRKDSTLDQKLHDVARCDPECFGELANCRTFDESNLFECVGFTSSADLIEHTFLDRAKTRCILITLGKASAATTRITTSVALAPRARIIVNAS